MASRGALDDESFDDFFAQLSQPIGSLTASAALAATTENATTSPGPSATGPAYFGYGFKVDSKAEEVVTAQGGTLYADQWKDLYPPSAEKWEVINSTRKRAGPESDEADSPRTPKAARISSASSQATLPAAPSTPQFPAPVFTVNSTHKVGSGFLVRVNNHADYGLGLKGRVTVDCQPPMGIEIGLIELFTLFPNSTQIPEVADRLMRNGVSTRQAAKLQLHPFGQVTQKNVKTVGDRLKKQFSDAGKKLYSGIMTDDTWSKTHATNQGVQTDLTATSWQLRGQYSGRGNAPFRHFKLVDIAGAVPQQSWPQGNDRLLATQCLEYAMAHPDQDLDTSHWNQLITTHGFQAPAAPAGYLTRDHEALKRFENAVQDPQN